MTGGPSRRYLPLTTARLRAGSSGISALADVTLDLALRGNVPSVFRQSAEDSERRPSLAIGPTRGQACNHERKS
jgi:hypothetical protein